jgi:vanillate O-demethylase ferredoxin subunit
VRNDHTSPPAAQDLPRKAFVLRLHRSGRSFDIPADESALAVLLKNGIDVAHTCTFGTCGSCVTRVLSGIPEHRDTVLSEGLKASNEFIALCVSRAVTAELTVDL